MAHEMLIFGHDYEARFKPAFARVRNLAPRTNRGISEHDHARGCHPDFDTSDHEHNRRHERGCNGETARRSFHEQRGHGAGEGGQLMGGRL